ncbi:type VI immunity family protein [Niveibacterium terrae]|uniref:type VI immunity family protein n=1 Tax=Niveibacterium terrae TaxID=3373598 RepID=UPI003A94937C
MFPTVTEPGQLLPLLEDVFQVPLPRWNLVDSSVWGDYIAYGIDFDLPDGRHTRQWVECAAARTGIGSWENIDHSRYWFYTNEAANFSVMLITGSKTACFGFASVISLHKKYMQQIELATEESKRNAQQQAEDTETTVFRRECSAALRCRLLNNRPEEVLTPAQYIDRYGSELLLTSSENGQPIANPVLFATVFFERGARAESRQALLECFDRFEELFGTRLKGGHLSGGSYCAKTARGINAMRRQILEASSVCFTRSDVSNQFAAPGFSLQALVPPKFPDLDDDGMLSCLEFTLPWSMAAGPELAVYQQYLSFICQHLSVRGGYGGLKQGLSYRGSAGHESYRTALSFTGLEIEPFATLETQNFRILSQEGDRERGPVFPYLKRNARVLCQGFIKSVNWYTLLGDVFVERLGDEESLRKQLKRQDIGIDRQGQCLLIRAGDFPRLGAPEEGLIEPYAFVNRALRPLRNPENDAFHRYLVPAGGEDCDETVRANAEDAKLWLARFDSPEDGPVQYWKPDIESL